MRRQILTILILLFSFLFPIRAEVLSNKKEVPGELIISKEIVTIYPQRKEKRVFSSSEPVLLAEFDLDKLDNPPFQPTFPKFDQNGLLYFYDFKAGLIHKIKVSGDYKKIDHSVIGKGLGRGPGEITRLLDFKIFKDRLYLLDEGKGGLEVYSTSGEYVNTIRPSNGYIPRMFTIDESELIIETLVPAETLFYAYDLSGKFKGPFGDYIEKNAKENMVYQDNLLSEMFSGNCFLYMPRFFGFIAMYKDKQPFLVRETIDGLKSGKKNIPVNKSVAAGITAQIVQKNMDTVYQYSLFGDILLVRAYDYKEETSFWDIYDARNLDYLISVKNRPRGNSFAMHGEKVAVLLETDAGFKLLIYDIGSIIKEAARNASKDID